MGFGVQIVTVGEIILNVHLHFAILCDPLSQ